MENPNWQSVYLKPSEVVLHNTVDDCWVSFLGMVKNITPLIQEYKHTALIKPIMAEAGKDISHWFSSDGEIQRHVHPVTGALIPYLPHGKIPHIDQPEYPDINWIPTPAIPWWKDDKYNVARLTKKSRPIRLFNVLTQTPILMNVCEEETIAQIRNRYKPYNSNAESYAWKYQKRELKMDKTLEENGIIDEREKFRMLGLPEDLYIPCLVLYYNDDFK